MKRFSLLLLLASICTIAHGASEKANTVLIHPGEVIYARFTQKGIKLTLVSAAKEKDDNAQIVLSLDAVDPAKKNAPLNLKLENKFTQDFHYKAQVRIVSKNLRHMIDVYPVVAGKLSLVPVPPFVDEVAVFAFELER